MTTSNDDLPVGRIAGVFGLRGELKCDPTSAGRTLFSTGAAFRAQLADGSERSVEVAGVRDHKGRLLIALRGVDSANDADAFAGATFYASRDRVELQPGEYLDRDLAGCVLYDERGGALGSVEDVEHYPSSDMLVVNGKLVPMVRAFIKSIDVEAKRIVVELPPGLLDEENAL